MIKPMLAKSVNNKAIDFTQPVFIQRKLDGIRCVITKEGAFTRNGNEIMNVEHIKKDLGKLFFIEPNLVLDGEIYNHDLKHDFNRIISLSRKQKPTEEHRFEAMKDLKFYWYDVIVEDLAQESRIEAIDYYFSLNNFQHVRWVDSTRITSEGDISDYHARSLELGYEGSIIRLNGTYENKRSNNLMKVKDFCDTEATIVGVVEGKGRLVGGVGKFLMIDDEGNEFSCPMGANTYEERRAAFDIKESYIGKIATFTYFQRTKANSYRHPIFKAIRNYE